MNMERKIIGYNPNTGEPIYENLNGQLNQQQPIQPNGMQQPMQPNGMQQPMQPNGMQQPMQPNGIQQPMQPNGIQQPMQPNAVQQPMQPNGMQQPMQPNGIQQPMQPNGMQQPMQPGKKNNKKKIIIFSIIIAVIIILVVFSNLSSKKDSIKASGNRTVMIYMVGADLESKNGMATMDLEEIKDSNLNLNDTNIVVYTGGADKWNDNFKNNTIYQLTDSGYKEIKSYDKTNMGDSNTLTSFIDYVLDNYDSELYDLILWDHGAGIYGYGFDEIYDDQLTLIELEKALKDSKISSNKKLEVIGFDACLMASVEVAAMVDDYANYMVASQESEPGYGWNYTFLSEVNKSTDTVELGKLIIDYNDDFYKDLSEQYSTYYKDYTFYTTLSLVELNKIEEIEDDINDLFDDVDTFLKNDGYSTIVSQMTKAKSFGYDGYDKSFDLIDIYNMAEQLEVDYEEAKDLKKSLKEAVVYEKSNIENANGLSIYYPYYTKTNLNKLLILYERFGFASEYTDFLKNYSKILIGNKLVNFDTKTIKPNIISENSISVELDDTLAQNYNKSNYIIFRDMKNGFYMPIYKSSDTSLKNNTLIANFNKKQLTIVDGNNDTGWATMVEQERNDKYAIYKIPIIMNKFKDEFTIDNAYIQLKVDKKHPNGIVVGVVPLVNVEDGMAAKQTINLKEWDTIQFFNSEMKFYDENGNFLTDWESSGDVYLTEVKTTEKYSIKFTELDKDYDYYCMFQLEDTQGNIHYTDLVKVD